MARKAVATGTDQLLCEVKDGVAMITLNRPEKRNALSNELTPALPGAAAGAGMSIALRYMKENLNRAVGVDLRSALALEADRMVRCTRTEDHREAVQAFIGKRKPSFRGKRPWHQQDPLHSL